MGIPRSVIAAAALAATAIAATATAAGPAAVARAVGPGPAGATLPDGAAPFAVGTRAIGAVPAASPLTIQFWLAPRAAAAESYAAAASTPGSPLFRHFLSPAAYTAGFAGVAADSGRDYVQATAPVSVIDAALKVQLRYYRTAGGRTADGYPLRASDRPVSLPAAVAASVLGVTGLDNAAPEPTYVTMGTHAANGKPGGKTAAFPCSQWYLQHYAAGLPRRYGTTRFPTVICGYSPQQLRLAYGYSAANTGRGVTIALVEVGLTRNMFSTLDLYAKAHGIQRPSPRRYRELSLGRGSACGDPFNVEEQMDVEASYDLAPLARQLVVGGDSCDNGFAGLQALYDADEAVLNGAGGHPLAQIVSNSWEGWDETTPANMLAVEHAYLIRAAVEGVSMLFSAGDSSGVQTPSSDPYATAVGGTTLGIGRDNPRIFETGWSTGDWTVSDGNWVAQGEQSASGGGASLLWSQPAYQQGVVPDSMAEATGDRGGLVRTVPDLSADADPYTGMAVGLLSFGPHGNQAGYAEQSVGGTSLAAPLIAGIVADAEQGQGPFGFLNPALYQLAGTGAFLDVLPVTGATPAAYRGVACDQAMCGLLALGTFDDQSWSMQGYSGQVTAPGYDTMTGIGTPNGQQFITGLRLDSRPMAKTASVSGASPGLSRGDDPPYPRCPRTRGQARRYGKTAIVSGASPAPPA
jgi:subtilase family serine protease